MAAWTKHLALIAAMTVGVAAAGAAGCGSEGDNRFGNGADGGVDGADIDAQFQDGDCLFGCGNGDSSTTQQLVIAPQNVVLTVNNGTVQTQDFTVTFNGNDVTSQVSWSYDTPIIGDVLSAATFTPTGKVAGVGTLTASMGNGKGSTTVSVKILKTVTGGVSQQQQQTLDNPNGPADSAQLVYPYDKTVFPLAVLAPEMQWNGAGSNDVYRLELKEKFYDYVEYFTTGTPSRHLVAQADWDGIESSGQGPNSDPLSVSLTRMSGNTAYKPIQQTWHIAQGKLFGSVYYWELPDACGSGNGRILKINPGATNVTQILNNGECWGCHTVSRDGNTILGNFSALSYGDETVDISQNPAVKTSTTFGTSTFSAFNDDGTKALMAHGNYSGPHTVDLVDVAKGTTLKGSVFSGYAAEPAWSPDGKKVAAITGISDSGWPFDSQSGDSHGRRRGAEQHLLQLQDHRPEGEGGHRPSGVPELRPHLQLPRLHQPERRVPVHRQRLALAGGRGRHQRQGAEDRRERRQELQPGLRPAARGRLLLDRVHHAPQLRQRAGLGQPAAALDHRDRRPADGRRPVAPAVLHARAGVVRQERERVLRARPVQEGRRGLHLRRRLLRRPVHQGPEHQEVHLRQQPAERVLVGRQRLQVGQRLLRRPAVQVHRRLLPEAAAELRGCELRSHPSQDWSHGGAARAAPPRPSELGGAPPHAGPPLRVGRM